MVLNTKVIDAETEASFTSLVFPHSYRMWNGKIAKCGKIFLELLVCQDGGLFKAVHPFVNLEINVIVSIHIIGGIVTSQNIFRNIRSMDFHKLRFWYRG